MGLATFGIKAPSLLMNLIGRNGASSFKAFCDDSENIPENILLLARSRAMSGLTPTGSSAGSRRFWIAVTIFALFNIAAWVGYHRWRENQMPPPLRKDIVTVESFSYQEGYESRDYFKPAVLTWRFNIDMADVPAEQSPSGNIAKDDLSNPAVPPEAMTTSAPATRRVVVKGQAPSVIPGTLTPLVEGDWVWRDARTLAFVAKNIMPQATTFKAVLHPDRLKSTLGYTLPTADEQTFETTRLALINCRQVAFDDQDRMILEFEFNDKIIPTEAAKFLQLTGPDNQKIDYELHGLGSGKTLRVQTSRIPLDANRSESNWLKFTFLPGLTGTSGPLGTSLPIEQNLAISTVLQATGISVYQPVDDAANIRLAFNNSVPDIQAIRPLISVEPAVEFSLHRTSDYTIGLSGAFEPATRYTVRIADVRTLGPATRPTTGENTHDEKDSRLLWSKYPRPTVLSVFVPDRPSSVQWHNPVNDGAYLGSKGNRLLLAKAVNVSVVRVSLERVYENNIVQWRNQKQRRGWTSISDLSKSVASKRYILENKKNVVQEIPVNIDELLEEKRTQIGDGAYRITIQPDLASSSNIQLNFHEDYYSYGTDSMVLTLSDIGLTTKLMTVGPDGSSGQALLTWAVSLSTGKPLAQVKVKIYSDKNQLIGQAITDDQGLAHLKDLHFPTGDRLSVLTAEHAKPSGGDGLTWLDLSSGSVNTSDYSTHGQTYLRKGYEAFVWTDRGVYRPGETVVLRALVRGSNMTTPGPVPVRWQIKRPGGHDWRSEKAVLNADGVCEWHVTIPADVVTGRWSAIIGLPGEDAKGSSGMIRFGGASFAVEEFVPDRIKSALQLSGPGLKPEGTHKGRLIISDNPLSVSVQADYLFGQPATELRTTLDVQASPVSFNPSGFENWVFEDSADIASLMLGSRQGEFHRIETMTGSLNTEGNYNFNVNLPMAQKSATQGRYSYKGPWQLSVNNHVFEVGGRMIAAYASVEADLLGYYVGIKTPQSVNIQENVATEIACVRVDGSIADEVKEATVIIHRQTWNTSLVKNDGRYSYLSTRVLEPLKTYPAVIKLTEGRGSLKWTPQSAGTYVIEVFTDTQQVSSTLVYVSDQAGTWTDNINRKNPERLELLLVNDTAQAETLSNITVSTPEFKPGGKIRAILRSPFAGQLLLTVETDTVLLTRIIQMDKNNIEVPLELPADIRPNGYVTASVVRAIDPNVDWRTHRAHGLARFSIDNTNRTLLTTIHAPVEIRPKSTLNVSITVKDSNGNLVSGAGVALVAVDEGILQLTGFQTPDALAFFSSWRALGVQTADLYSMLMPEIKKPEGVSRVGGGGGEGDEEDVAPVRRRSAVHARRFVPVALIGNLVNTDEKGQATVNLQVPEFVGQLRIMVVTYAGEKIGKGTGKVIVRSPLMVQSSLPRFLAPGDNCEVPLLIFNNTKQDGDVKVRVESLGKESPLQVTRGGELTFTVPAGGQVIASASQPKPWPDGSVLGQLPDGDADVWSPER
jgi:alpha-2-macroglobulin